MLNLLIAVIVLFAAVMAAKFYHWKKFILAQRSGLPLKLYYPRIQVEGSGIEKRKFMVASNNLSLIAGIVALLILINSYFTLLLLN